ncbi:hypothetical protein PF005_g28578 [Phytophthora fragariae]|uniref:Uncharacterized protein n=1 Tax=Phytophthora fragariae TaxID=53985 RepID=A0A6A3HDH9_9STRA|nr:hypothetical protein PF003_g33110 [Phytophthora fragariae]KAE8930348.1 hypothetical protein PF009_g19555 [Phytophthora fragariae]KAE8967430.1 hypothetical protein PF011_g27560 [Phytophthora fragariae]KAE9065539.1 hypothetical protein PF010_g28155 [Phytophthora fragariae]KAE9066273.1 hypothetical protein PF007_g28537 [Phytophthora fragariae]
MSEYSEMAHKHMANAPGSAVNESYPVYQSQPVPMPQHPVRFQELPRLQVPPFALTTQSTPAWKLPQEQPAPRMSVSNLLSGSFRSRNTQPQQTPLLMPPSPPAPVQAPAPRRLPSFADILARTNLLHLVGRSSEPTEAPAPAMEAAMEEEMQMQQQPEQMMAPVYHQQPQPPMMQPMEGSYTVYAPPRVDTTMSMDTSSTMGDELQSPMGAASPVSQTSETNKRRERWTEDEHARFMEGLNRYGRKWKKIQTFVKTKTAVQVRTHAYGYFAKLLRNMPEDDAIWELAEEMSSLPGAVLKGPGNGKRRNEPKTDEAGMEVLRRFVFSKKKSEDKKQLPAPSEDRENVEMAESTPSNANSQAPTGSWSSTQQWKADDSDALLEIKRQRLN